MTSFVSFHGTQGEFCSHLSPIPGNRSLCKSHTEFAITSLFPRPHEKTVKITHCSLRWLSQHKELIDRTLPKLHGALCWPRTYVHIDYCVYDSQGLKDTNAECPTCLIKLNTEAVARTG